MRPRPAHRGFDPQPEERADGIAPFHLVQRNQWPAWLTGSRFGERFTNHACPRVASNGTGRPLPIGIADRERRNLWLSLFGFPSDKKARTVCNCVHSIEKHLTGYDDSPAEVGSRSLDSAVRTSLQ